MLEFSLSESDLAACLQGDRAPINAALAAADLPDPAPDLAGTAELVVATFTSPAVQTQLRLRRAGAAELVDGWLGAAMVVVVQEPGDRVRVIVGLPQTLPRLVAELVGLGPRPFDPASVPPGLPYAMLGAYAGIGAGAEFLAGLHGIESSVAPHDLDALLDGEALRWTLSARTDADASDPGTCIDVVDAGDRGLWIITAGSDDETIVAVPAASTAVWVLLAGALGSALAPIGAA